MAKDMVTSRNYDRVGGDRPKRGRTGQRGTGTSSRMAFEVACADAGDIGECCELGANGGHHQWSDELINHTAAGEVERSGDSFAGRSGC
jgi:hypothetical protein